MSNKNLPYIIIFDIDNTIIGDCRKIQYEYDILCRLCKNNKLGDITNECIKLDITEELSNGIIRPYLKEFMDFCKTKYKNVEFFINKPSYDPDILLYNKLIENMEKILNMKFNKTILNMTDKKYDKYLSLIHISEPTRPY